MFAFHETDRVSYHAEGDEIILSASPHDCLNNLARRLTESLDGSQYAAVIQIAILAQDAFVTGLIDIEAQNLASKPVLHNHTTRRSSGWIGPKIICLGNARSQTSKAKQTERYGGGQCEHLSREWVIHFHTRDYSFQSRGLPSSDS
jgi:hypothetical protein